MNAQDAPVTVNLTLIKKDAETLLPEPQGAASLDGAEYEATYLHGGEYVTAKGVVENSKLAFEGIPLGTVTIKETKAPPATCLTPSPRDNRHSGHGGQRIARFRTRGGRRAH